MSAYAGALEAIDRILNRGGDADDVLRAVVSVLHERFDHYSWIGIYLVEGDELVLGPWHGPGGDGTRTDSDRPGSVRRRRRQRADGGRRRRQL